MHRITFNVGIGMDRNDEPLDDVQPRITAGVRYVSQSFGGCTAVRGVGGWIDDTGRLITEESLTLTADITELPEGADVLVMADETAGALRDIFHQTAVRVTVSDVQTWDRHEKGTMRKAPAKSA